MNEKTLRALIEAGAVRRVHIVGNGARFHVEADTATGTLIAATLKGAPKTWRTLDSAARWIKDLGLGSAQLDLRLWQPEQRGLAL